MKCKYNILNMFLIVLFVLIYPYRLYGVIINVPGDVLTIQGGIDSSSTGDTVLVQPGIYYENINYNGKNIVVGSLFITTGDTAYISQTVIDGNQNGSVVTFRSGEDTTAALIGFTITNGLCIGDPYYIGGGVTCKNYSSPILENVMITGNSGNLTNYGFGGGIFCYNSSLSLKNVTITNNSVNTGFGGGINCSNSRRSLKSVKIAKKN